MPKSPAIPSERRSFCNDKARDRLRSAQPDRRDETADHPAERSSDLSPDQSR
jgi:hypothetical protein